MVVVSLMSKKLKLINPLARVLYFLVVILSEAKDPEVVSNLPGSFASLRMTIFFLVERKPE